MSRTMPTILALALAAAGASAAGLKPGVTRGCAVDVYGAWLAAPKNSAASRDLGGAADRLIVMAAVEEGVTTEDGRFRRGIAEEALAKRKKQGKAPGLHACLARARGR